MHTHDIIIDHEPKSERHIGLISDVSEEIVVSFELDLTMLKFSPQHSDILRQIDVNLQELGLLLRVVHNRSLLLDLDMGNVVVSKLCHFAVDLVFELC